MDKTVRDQALYNLRKGEGITQDIKAKDYKASQATTEGSFQAQPKSKTLIRLANGTRPSTSISSSSSGLTFWISPGTGSSGLFWTIQGRSRSHVLGSRDSRYRKPIPKAPGSIVADEGHQTKLGRHSSTAVAVCTLPSHFQVKLNICGGVTSGPVRFFSLIWKDQDWDRSIGPSPEPKTGLSRQESVPPGCRILKRPALAV
ncbi:hypothetical protein EDB89DRAFT_1912292 [Lactarius sanguifluus]|nr:hypothetical protein EDB89DRAFT_1912292 [Lactarius sanguifluus]